MRTSIFHILTLWITLIHKCLTFTSFRPPLPQILASQSQGRRGGFHQLFSDRRGVLASGLNAGIFGGIFGSDDSDESTSSSTPSPPPSSTTARLRKLGNNPTPISSITLGTQRWVSSDFNAPSTEECFKMLDLAYTAGINSIDTAEQYPIPSDLTHPEGSVETLIGKWMKSRSIDRSTVHISTKITGATNVTPNNIRRDLAGSLDRLQTSYVDTYLLHWPHHYQPQSNWGQSLRYDPRYDYPHTTTFEDVVKTMHDMVKEGKIKGWGTCNDSAYGLTKYSVLASSMGLTKPCAFQGDYSICDRKSEENGVLECCSGFNEGIGFMGYNLLAGGMLTGKYMGSGVGKGMRGRMDTRGWGGTLYRYQTGPVKEAIREYDRIAKENGMELGEMAVRWGMQRDGVTTLCVGSSNVAQLEDLIRWKEKGERERLGPEVMWEIDRVHMKNRNPVFANDKVPKEWYGEGLIGENIP